MAKAKPDDEKTKDIKKLKDEMAEGKSPKEVEAIYSKGGKYYCAECHRELPMRQSCPNCHLEIDWDRATLTR
jgi:hypothetical protein